jgi:hypothetical protein
MVPKVAYQCDEHRGSQACRSDLKQAVSRPNEAQSDQSDILLYPHKHPSSTLGGFFNCNHSKTL